MTALEQNLRSFVRLGHLLGDPEAVARHFDGVIRQQSQQNPWFTPEFCRKAIAGIAAMLEEKAIEDFAQHYESGTCRRNNGKRVAVVSAGNFPIAAFHDFFCILAGGNRYVGKLSARDRLLLPKMTELLLDIEPAWADSITFVDKVGAFDAVIATGSDNSARYFDYYFRKYPHILRHNRNSIAVLDGSETEAELQGLSEDIFLYFGLGCRSVSKLFVPEGYDFGPLLQMLNRESSPWVAQHTQFLNNLEYQKAIRIMNSRPYLDAGTFILSEEEAYGSPVAVVHYQYYDRIGDIRDCLDRDSGRLQCVVAHPGLYGKAVPFGKAQRPALTDYPDGVDIMDFLSALA